MSPVAGSVTDAELDAKGLTAPRVTRADLEAEIVDEFFFTAAQGIAGAYPIPAHSIDLPQAVKLLTFCVLVLRNGFTFVGQSACVSAANFDPEIGRRIARDKAIEQMWVPLGFRLADRLHNEGSLVGSAAE